MGLAGRETLIVVTVSAKMSDEFWGKGLFVKDGNPCAVHCTGKVCQAVMGGPCHVTSKSQGRSLHARVDQNADQFTN